MQAGLETEFLQALQDVFRRALDIRAIVEHEVAPGAEHIVIQELPFAQIDRAEEVLGMEVIGARAGDAQAFGDPGGDHLDDEGLFEVDDVRPPHRFLDEGDVRLGELVSVGLDESVEDRDVEIAQDIFRLGLLGLVIAAGKHADFFSCFFQITDRTPGRGGKPVAGSVVIVDDKEYLHSAGKDTKLLR